MKREINHGGEKRGLNTRWVLNGLVVKQMGMILTTLFWILIRVVATVILPVALPTQRFTEGVITLELIQWAVPSN